MTDHGPAFNPGGGDSELTIPPDSVGENASISDWSQGLSMMEASVEAAWDGFEEKAMVVTYRMGDNGFQMIVFAYGGGGPGFRYWDGIETIWHDWFYPPALSDIAGYFYDKAHVDALEARIEALENP